MTYNIDYAQGIIENAGLQILDDNFEYFNMEEKMILIDSDGYKYYSNLRYIQNGKIEKIGKQNPFSLYNICNWITITGKPYKYVSGEYIDSLSKSIFLLCDRCGNKWYTQWNYMLNNRGCPYCAKKVPSKENNLAIRFPEILEDWDYKSNGSPYNYTPRSNKKVSWICFLCGFVWISTIANRTIGQGCPVCSGSIPTKENNLFVKFPQLMDEWDWDKNGNPQNYLPYSNKKVGWICKTCGEEWFTIIANRTAQETICPSCASSKGNRKIYDFLKRRNIDFIPEYKFLDCKGKKRSLPFDAYIPKYDCCIEYQGEQHYYVLDNEHFGGDEELKIRQENDRIKLEYCQNNNICLIIIPYWEFDNIESILESELFLS